MKPLNTVKINDVVYETFKSNKELLEIDSEYFDLRDMYDVHLDDGRIKAVGRVSCHSAAGSYIVSHYGGEVLKVVKWLKRSKK